MKTTYSFLKRTCLFLVLFCWLVPTNLMADVTVEWGDWGSAAFPTGSSTIDGITFSEELTYCPHSGWWVGGGQRASECIFEAGENAYITVSSAVIFSVSASYWNNGGTIYIEFCSSASYDANYVLSTETFTGYGQTDHIYSPITAPSGTKSARLYSNGEAVLISLSVTAVEEACANPVSASFAKEGSESGSVPVTMNSCEGNPIIIPNQGSLVNAGYDFVGWSYNSTTYAPGASFTMPATNVTFTAVWEQHYVPAVTNLTSSVSGSDVTLNWTNYNKLEMTSSNVEIAGWNDGSSTMSYTINNGVLDCEYNIVISGWNGYRSVEIRLPRERNHVTSIDLKYIFNDANCSSGGGLLPYMMYDGWETGHENNWTSYYIDYTSYNASEWTDFNLVPTTILWGSGSGAYEDQWLIHKVGFVVNPPVASSGTFSIKDIYINTSDGQTLLDEVIVVRKEGSAPTSVSDGTQVYNGLLNTCTDNSLADGDYYYAVFAREGDAYSAVVVTQVHIGAIVPSLTTYERPVAPGEYGTVCIGYAVEHENISGATMFEIDEWSADGKTLTLSELGASEAMVAGRPYIFLASASTLSLGYDGSASEAPAGNHNGLIGSYTQEEIDKDDDNYIIYQNKLYLVDVLAYVGEHRAYIHKTDATPSPAPRRRVTLSVNGTQTTTGVDQLNSHSANGKFIKDGQLFIIRDGRTSNAQGIELK